MCLAIIMGAKMLDYIKREGRNLEQKFFCDQGMV